MMVGTEASALVTLRTPRDGRLDAVGIQIGNYRNTSDGSLVVEACVETECRRSRAALSESRDNQSFMLEMSDPLPVSEGAPLRLTLRREGGTRPLVFWSYGAVAGSAKVKVQEGRDHPRTVRIELEYAD